ncbi:MAG TPA: glycerophosphoryl diester phosphodiesterase membrane domain-containing protein [Allosphingosinicella sp.]|nr:glycerophosphoryl diester phosphodiesterase membrane domain-containing protein [Allosphingosinicella sp.]
MSRADSDPGALLREALALARDQLALAAAALVVLTAFDTATDWLGRSGSGLILLSLPATLFLQYEITLAALSQRGLAERRGRRRFWALLGLSILSGLAIVIGCILLVLPGLYLFIRWSLSVPILIAEDAGPLEALSRSAAEVSGRFWRVAGLFLLVYLPLLASFAVAMLTPLGFSLPSSLAENVLTNLALIGGWFAAVAAYGNGKGENRLAEVFA